MKISRIGHILYVRQYDACILFYQQTLKLPILFKNEDLTCFDFFGTYLMVEKEDQPEYLNDNSEKTNYSCIRINVENVKHHSDDMKSQGAAVDYQEHSWGVVAKFKDPDGNLIAFKDEVSFAKQIEDYKK